MGLRGSGSEGGATGLSGLRTSEGGATGLSRSWTSEGGRSVVFVRGKTREGEQRGQGSGLREGGLRTRRAQGKRAQGRRAQERRAQERRAQGRRAQGRRLPMNKGQTAFVLRGAPFARGCALRASLDVMRMMPMTSRVDAMRTPRHLMPCA
eukprot:363547-Chlamydomonas_euryale.AAC.2